MTNRFAVACFRSSFVSVCNFSVFAASAPQPPIPNLLEPYKVWVLYFTFRTGFFNPRLNRTTSQLCTLSTFPDREQSAGLPIQTTTQHLAIRDSQSKRTHSTRPPDILGFTLQQLVPIPQQHKVGGEVPKQLREHLVELIAKEPGHI